MLDSMDPFVKYLWSISTNSDKVETNTKSEVSWDIRLVHSIGADKNQSL